MIKSHDMSLRLPMVKYNGQFLRNDHGHVMHDHDHVMHDHGHYHGI